MILSNLWMTLQKVEAAGHGDYVVNFAGDLCFTERNLAVLFLISVLISDSASCAL